jgi:hypothetical protein
MMNELNTPIDHLYEQAKKILAANPGIGKKRLGQMLGIKTPSSRLRIFRYRGETQGHGTEPDYIRVRQLKEASLDWSAARIATELGLTIDHARLHLARWLGAQSFQGRSAAVPPVPAAEPEAPAHGAELRVCGQGDNQALSYRGSRIRTVEELLAYTQTDTAVWEIERQEINKWEVGMKDPMAGGILTEPLFQIKLWLRRKAAEQALQKFMNGMLEKFQQAAPIRPSIPRRSGNKGLLEISIMDHHSGKYCCAMESGRAYDADIAERMFITALEDLLQKSAALPTEKILMVCGNDFFNTDQLGRTTTAGTPQDEALRYQESFLRGRQLLVRAVDRLCEVAPVHVVMVTGNHDTQRLYYLGDVLAAWFRNNSDVQIDNSPSSENIIYTIAISLGSRTAITKSILTCRCCWPRKIPKAGRRAATGNFTWATSIRANIKCLFPPLIEQECSSAFCLRCVRPMPGTPPWAIAPGCRRRRSISILRRDALPISSTAQAEKCLCLTQLVDHLLCGPVMNPLESRLRSRRTSWCGMSCCWVPPAAASPLCSLQPWARSWSVARRRWAFWCWTRKQTAWRIKSGMPPGRLAGARM